MSTCSIVTKQQCKNATFVAMQQDKNAGNAINGYIKCLKWYRTQKWFKNDLDKLTRQKTA